MSIPAWSEFAVWTVESSLDKVSDLLGSDCVEQKILYYIMYVLELLCDVTICDDLTTFLWIIMPHLVLLAGLGGLIWSGLVKVYARTSFWSL